MKVAATRLWSVGFHQILSIVQEKSGIHKDELYRQLRSNYTFVNISKEEIVSLLKHMLIANYLENINGELIIGVHAERLISGRNFYTVFQTPISFKVILKNKIIGEIPPSPQIAVNQNIFLAANVWKIEEVDIKQKKVFVKKATDGRSPLFFGSAGDIHPRIREQMLSILMTNDPITDCNEEAQDQITDLRNLFRDFDITDYQCQRPVFIQEDKISFYTFTGSRINRTIYFLLNKLMEIPCKLIEQNSLIEFPNTSIEEFRNHMDNLLQGIPNLSNFLLHYLEDKEHEFQFSKWGGLPAFGIEA